ncbi:MAG: ferrochelatase [Spirochaetia bacterium]|nr:ferrochelatase [Spirochaetia bacterium]
METAKSTGNSTGALLLNLGTPDSPRVFHVRRYLRQFLSDSRVIDLPAPLRFLLLNLVILPLRPYKSAEAYAKIWTSAGSPLLIHTRDLASEVARQIPGTSVRFAMRYGNPSIESALDAFEQEGVRRIRVIPLYPQYATASTASSLAELYECAARKNDPFEFEILPPFFADPDFVRLTAKHASIALDKITDPYVLFSFHGLPERQIKRSTEKLSVESCFSSQDCCDHPGERLSLCYRAQSFATAHAVAKLAGIKSDRYEIAFQSRLGRTPWIRPYTDERIKALPGLGIKNLAVICPSFTADCLETLEEIDIRAREDFLRAGGESFHYIPCLNSDAEWARVVASWLS